MGTVSPFRSRTGHRKLLQPVSRGVRWVAGHPWLVLALVAVATLPAAYLALGLTIDSSAERLLQPTDPAVRYYEEVRGLFGNEEVDAVVVVADDVYSPETLAKIARLDERLSRVAGVERVQSIASIEAVHAGPDGSLEHGLLMAPGGLGHDDVASLRARLDSDPILGDTLVSRDGKAAMLMLGYERMPEHEFVHSGAVDRVREILAAEQGPEQLHLVGSPSLRVAASHLLRRDVAIFTPISALALALVLFLSFRSLRGVLVPMTTVGIGLVWTVGLMAFLDVPLDVVGLTLPSLLLAIGSAYSTHVVAAYYDETANGGSRTEILGRVLGHIGPPVVITAFTTLTGFAALGVYRIPAIRSFGLFATFGIAVLFFLSLTFTAALLAVLPLPRRRGVSADREWPWLRRVLDGFASFDERHRAPLLASAVVLVAVLVAGIPRIEFDTDVSRYFASGSPERIAGQVLGEHFGGNFHFLVGIDSTEPGTITRLDTLRRIEQLQRSIEAIPGVTATSSIADVVALSNRALHDDDPAALGLPDSDEAVQQYLLLVPPEATEAFLTTDGARGVIRVRSSLNKSSELAGVLAMIEARGADLFPRTISIRTTGAMPLVYRTADDLAAGQVASVVLALVVIFVTMSAYFVSVRLGLVAMLPNLVPIVLYFGILGWTGIPLSITTALIASMALGLGVDEAIHLLSEFNRRVRVHGDQQRAIHEAMATVGPPVVFTTLALTFGALAQAVSGFVPIQQFAWFSALNVVTSLFADLLLMPALVSSVRFVTIWDLVSLKLGHAPEQTIPLFRGLTRAQARVAVLMGQLRRVETGERFVTCGSVADEMFLVLSGRAEVRVRGIHGLVTLTSIERGSVVGEMGLLRRQPRSADVVAVEPSEVLRVDQRFFDVLAKRYPRVASTILKNLACALSDRLQVVSEQILESGRSESKVRAG